MSQLDHLGIDKLRHGRVSITGARYFVTACTEGRKAGLTNVAIAEGILSVLRDMQQVGDLDLFCATIMPDHIHMLYSLGRNLSLGQVQGKFKALTKGVLDASGLKWQGNYFDHRLREHVPMERFARYIYLNPYVKGLIGLNDQWSHWVLNREYLPEFLVVLEGLDAIPSEWLVTQESAKELIDQDSGI